MFTEGAITSRERQSARSTAPLGATALPADCAAINSSYIRHAALMVAEHATLDYLFAPLGVGGIR